VYVCKLEQ